MDNIKKDSVFLDRFQSVRSGEDTWYHVLQFLGKGGNGTAFLISCSNGKYKGAIFTLKIFHKISSAVRKERFLREIACMKDIHHPNILQQYDEGEWNGYPFVVMDYMPNSLQDEIERKNITIEKGLLYSLQLLSAIKCLHSMGFVHRDIKPGNIYIKSSNAILGDFGLIKRFDVEEEEFDVEGYIAMPKFYRTPELVEYARNGNSVGFESDVFQLGLVIAEIFCGYNPEEPSDDLIQPITINKITTPVGKYGKRILWVILGMLKKDKKKRLTVDKALDYFNSIYEDYLKDKVDLNGSIM